MPTRNTTAAAASDAADRRGLRKAGARGRQAGHGRLRLRDRGRRKADQSPVTAADHASERLILEGCAAFPGHPVRRRGRDRGGRRAVPRWARLHADRSARRHARIRQPAAGFHRQHRADPQWRARGRRRLRAGPRRDAFGLSRSCRGDRGRATAMPSKAAGRCMCAPASTPLTIVASRSHRTHDTDLYIRNFDAAEIVSVGSSLKFCMIAGGEADLYPRFGRTMEWDTAAGDAVLRAAGGMTTTLDGAPLTYGKRGRRWLPTSSTRPSWRRGGSKSEAELLRGDPRRALADEAADRGDDRGPGRCRRDRDASAGRDPLRQRFRNRQAGRRAREMPVGDLLVQRLDVVDHRRDAERLQMRLERVAIRRLDRILRPGRARALARTATLTTSPSPSA